jgi:hypothetical protein
MFPPVSENHAALANSTMEFPTSLHKLPFEMRLEIYKHVQPLFKCHLSESRGLLLSHPELAQEFSYEVIKDINNYYEDIEKKWMKTYTGPLVISKPATIADITNITVSIPNSFFRRDRNGGSPRFPEALLALIPLHLSSITIDFYEDEKAKDGEFLPSVGFREVGGFASCVTHLLYEKIAIALDDQTFHIDSDKLGTNQLRINWEALSAQDAHVVAKFLRGSHEAYKTTTDHDDALKKNVGVTWDRI